MHEETFHLSVATHFWVILQRPGIDKITEKAQVSQDGTMVTVPRSESQAGASDTESNSERDGEVRQRLRHSNTSLHLLVAGVNKAQSLLTSGAPGGVGGGQESLGQRLVGTGSLERRSGVGQSALRGVWQLFSVSGPLR